MKHHRFHEVVDYLRAGDVMVFNDSYVIPARLRARKADTGGKLEVLLVRRVSPNVWETLVKPGRRVRVGSRVEITSGDGNGVAAEVIGIGQGGIRLMSFSDETLLPEMGRIPLPPYIHAPLADAGRYQTVYADAPGSIAAPTAGLHFTEELIGEIKDKGVDCLFVTLHVGLDTFHPVQEDDPRDHGIHQEYGVVAPEVASRLSQAKAEGRRIICVGTTVVRLVEAAAQASSPFDLQPFSGWISLFILPGYRFHMVDALVTNFHLPRSTLLMMVSAFAGKGLVDKAYQEAIAQRYRFYSFGDAMLVL